MRKIIYLFSKLHGFNRPLDYCIELACKILFPSKAIWRKYLLSYADTYRSFEPSVRYFSAPQRFLKYMAMVLKSPVETEQGFEKGTLVIAYNYAFPTFFTMFEHKKILDRYHLVLEPSTARYLMPEIVMHKGLDEKVYVQTAEPRDKAFLTRFFDNAIPVDIVANWWVDSRVFKPNPSIEKDIDILMVSSWLKMKRHYLLFEAMAKLKQKGLILKCALVGYPIDMTKEDILKLAENAGVLEQIELHEWLNQEQIAVLYQRSKLNLLLSKREGFNRSIIEGLHCDVPCFIRKGFNFGDEYDHINPLTGGYFEDHKLVEVIENALNNLSDFKANKWLTDYDMTAQNASRILNRAIYGKDDGLMASKVSSLDGMEYWDKSDDKRFAQDYEFLHTCLRDDLP